jgi:hypothetical protein
VTNSTQHPYWVFLYNDFVLQTEPNKMRVRLETLELALADRMIELKGSKDYQAETLAIKEASRRLLQLKVEKLGIPPVSTKSASSNARQT